MASRAERKPIFRWAHHGFMNDSFMNDSLLACFIMDSACKSVDAEAGNVDGVLCVVDGKESRT